MNEDYIDQDVVADFLDEAGQCVATLNDNLLQVESGDISEGQVDEMFRAAHSMKGAAGFLNFSAISKVTHSLETILDKVRKNELSFNPGILDALFSSLDIISALLAELSTEQQGTVDITPIVKTLDSLLNREAGPADDNPENHLGPLPDFIKGKMELDDMLEALIAKNAGKRVYLLKLSLKDIFNLNSDPVALYHTLENTVYVQATIPLMAETQSLWLPLDSYNSEIVVLCFCDKQIKEALTSVPLPDCLAWEICPDSSELPKPVVLESTLFAQLGNHKDELTITPAMLKHKPIWISETREELNRLDNVILDYEKTPQNTELLNEAFRLMHRIKGSSGSMGLDEITRITHNCESLLAQLRDKQETPDDNLFQLFYSVKDFLHECLVNIESDITTSPNSQELDQLFEGYLKQACSIPNKTTVSTEWNLPDELKKNIEDYILSGSSVYKVTAQIYDDTPLADIRCSMILRNLDDIGEVIFSNPTMQSLEAGMEHPPPLQVILAGNVTEKMVRDNAQIDMVQHISIEKLKIEKEKAQTETSQTPAVKSNKTAGTQLDTVRVDTSRLDHLMNIAGELAITKARITQLVDYIHNQLRNTDLLGIELMLDTINNNNMAHKNSSLTENRLRKLENWLESFKQTQQVTLELRDTSLLLHNNTSQIQSSVMQMRMVPIGPLFQRFHRLVRDLCKEKNKQAKLLTIGENTELDKKLIDELADPLTHLIRNSVDHGLETVDNRKSSGKDTQGTVQLRAFHEGSQICIQIQDDGRGLSIEKIKQKALTNKLCTPEALERLSTQDIYQLIFQPGFSTAEKITNISGRGVGMDIVKNKVNELKGKIEIESTPGHGCTFTIRLPLTLAMIQTLLVDIGGDKYAIPLESVREISEFPLCEIKTVKGKGRIVSLRNEVISLISLAKTIGIKEVNENSETVKAVITKTTGAPMAIPVNRILGQDEVVVKPLTEDFSHVKGLAGATVLGDGRIALILNIPAIKDLCVNLGQHNLINKTYTTTQEEVVNAE
jgi:two-component system chemotaxis sensor kinase CheA